LRSVSKRLPYPATLKNLIAAQANHLAKISVGAISGVPLSPFGCTLTYDPIALADGVAGHGNELFFGFCHEIYPSRSEYGGASGGMLVPPGVVILQCHYRGPESAQKRFHPTHEENRLLLPTS
jgi:hypothetical protein